MKRWLLGMAVFFVGLSVLLVMPLRWLAPPTSAFMLQARYAAGGRPVQYDWRPLEQISPHLGIAVVAAEDQQFPHHYGFDLDSIRQAFEQRHQRLRGASTLTQQVAKNLYLWPGQSLFRKGVEAWLALCIETLWPKRRILEVYLNIAEFAPGVYGAEAGARHHFGVPASRLGARQAVLMAAVLPSPGRMSAGRPSPYVHRRADEILRQVRNLGESGYLAEIMH